MNVPTYGVVAPTLGRASLRVLVDGLSASPGARHDAPVIVVDDRPVVDHPLALYAPIGMNVRVIRSSGRGPAAARNTGWQELPDHIDWVVFVDDDVELPVSWRAELESDLVVAQRRGQVGSQGRLHVPVPAHRRPTDWERATAGLATAAWITADMAYRRDVLRRLGGFDERFPRAYREDAELALRVLACGYSLGRGSRTAEHPVRRTGFWTSLRVQRGNADDVLMRRLHGSSWRLAAQAPRGRFAAHAGVAAAGLVAAAAAATRHRRVAAGPGAWCLGATALFAARRIAPGPRDRSEVTRMLATSAAIPWAAVWWRLRAEVAHRRVSRWSPPAAEQSRPAAESARSTAA